MKKWIKENWPISSLRETNLFMVLFLIAIFFIYLLPPIDTDLGWHLRYGEHIWKTHAVWKTNEIGFFLKNYQWAHSRNLSQLLIFIVFNYFGFWGLTLLNALVITLVFLFVYKSYSKRIIFLILGSIFIFLISNAVTNLGLRSQLFTFLGVSFLFYYLLANQNFTWKKIFLFPLIFLVWANLHGGFILGFVLLIFALLEKIILEKVIRKNIEPILKLTIAITGSFLATLINPFGVKTYSEIFRHSWYPLNKLIAEWLPPNKADVFLILISASLVFLGLIIQKNFSSFLKKKRSIFLILSWLFFLFFALKAKRHLPLFGLASVHFLIHLFPTKKAKLSSFFRFSKKAAIFVIFALSILYRFKNLPDLSGGWNSICQLSRWPLPCEAVEHLKTDPEACPHIFNAYEWGGFLAWHLPKNKTFVDGRMPAWPTPERKSPYTIYLEILQTKEGFEEKLDQYQADCLFIGQGTFLDLELKDNPRSLWKKTYEDKIAVIYQRKN